MNYRQVIFILLLLGCATYCFAFDQDKYKYDELWKLACGYRADISPEVREMILSWDRPGRFHTDRIGKLDLGMEVESYYLDGSKMFPDIAIHAITQELIPGYFKVEDNGYSTLKKFGVIRDDGKMIVPLEYNSVDFDKNGYFLTTKHEGEIIISSIYSLDGVKVFEGDPANGKYSDKRWHVTASYNPKSHLYIVNHANQAWVVTTKGDIIMGPIKVPKGQYAFFSYSDPGKYSLKKGGKYVDIPIKGYTQPANYPEMDFSFNDINSKLDTRFYGNYWINLALIFYEDQRYEDALNCLRIFDESDYTDKFTTDCKLLVLSMLMDSAYQAGDNAYLYSLTPLDFARYGVQWVKPGDYLYKEKGLYFGIIGSEASLTFTTNPTRTRKMWGTCQDVYNNVIKPFQENRIQAEKQAKREERNRAWAIQRNQNAELWGAILLGAVQVTAAALSNANNTSYQSGGTYQSYGTAAPAYSESYESSSSSQRQKRVRTCSVCKGTGKETKETFMGSSTAGKKKWCDVCHKDVYHGHYHVSCTTCHGTGQIEY